MAFLLPHDSVKRYHIARVMSETSSTTINLQGPAAKGSEPLMMPQAPGAEKSLLSMMCIDPAGIISKAVTEGLTGDYFYIPAHRILWEIFSERYAENKPIDITSITQELTDSKRLDAVGGHQGLMDVFSYVTSTALFATHLEIIKEKYLRRCIILTSNDATAKAFSSEEDVDALLDSTEAAVLQIRNSAAKDEAWTLKSDIQKAMNNLERMMNSKGDILGISSGFPELDKKVNGLKSGELFVIAARPAMGKTSFLLNIVEDMVLNQKKPVLVFSCEMPSVQLVERLLYARSGLSRQTLMQNNGTLTREQMQSFVSAMKELSDSQLIIDDTPGISIGELRAKARRVMKDHGQLAAIGIDYLQLMKSKSKQAENSREREIAEISGGLKNLAKELGLPIIVLAQLNRGPEGRTGKNKGTPMMSDLRESGAIEQDADMIGLLYRSAYYAEDEEERAERGNDATLLLAKNRNGPAGSIYLSFRAELMKFIPREAREDEEEE